MHYLTTLTGTDPVVLTIGNFDGIHKGHQELMREVCTMAQRLHSLPVLLTFQPHTLKVVRPEIELRCLTTLEEKLALTRIYGGIADSIVIEFTQEVASMSAAEFLDALRERFELRGLVVGENFSLGHNRMGNVAFLRAYGAQHRVEVLPIPLEEVEYQRVSSTRVRGLVSEGNVAEASELLGHTFVLNGIVVRGDQRGRLLGFPTANLLPPADKLIPAYGVYAARVLVAKESVPSDIVHSPCVLIDDRVNGDGTSQRWDAYNSAVNIGVRPTFDGQRLLIEAHLLDVADIDLYDRCIGIHFIARLRSEQRFAGVEALKAQIAEDVRNARILLQKGGQE
ncbi:MAG TPA: bifunctional riboflavin kinase/FAD synthetase [Ktedonobacteraceae bacterium]|jgi:riboflavin kinase/FMN adenylyltransferase